LVLRLDADVLSGIGVEGLEVRSEGEGILLFDEDGDGRVDSFYLSGAEVELGDIAIGSGVRAGGEALLSASGARLSLRGLTTVAGLLEEGEAIGGELRLQGRSGRVGVREGVVVEVGESREIGGSEWGLEGVIDVSEKELRVGMERVDVLVGGGEIVKLSADPAGEKRALELRIGLNGEVRDGNELWFELSDMRGEFGVFGGGEGAPELSVERVGVQVDGDVEVGVLGLRVPSGYGSEWFGGLGVLPLRVEEGELSFGERGDGSADWSEVELSVRGVVQLGGLREGLRSGLGEEGLEVEWWSEVGGVWKERQEGEVLDVEFGVQGEGAWRVGELGVVNSAAQRVVLDGWRLPLPGGGLEVRGELLIGGVDGEGKWEAIGSELLPEGVKEGAEVVLLVEGVGEGGGEWLQGAGSGRAVLYGEVRGDGKGGVVLDLGGVLAVRDGEVDLTELGVSVSGGYGEVELGWELCVREGEWSGVPVV
jgi:hypothetical protein